jgi:WhiB family redox-sensing transcriptional regulator
VDAARRVCADCPVKTECLEYALANRIDHGVWGGTSERERRRILKARARERVAQPS